MLENQFVEEDMNFEDSSIQPINEITDITAANWYVRKIKENKAQAVLYKEQAKQILDDYDVKVKQWLATKLDALERDNEFRLGLLEEYYKKNLPTKGKTISVPEGNFGLRKKLEVFEYKPEVLDVLLKHKDVLSDFIVNEPKLNKNKIKQEAQVHDGMVWLKNIPIPGMTHVAAQDKFEVR